MDSSTTTPATPIRDAKGRLLKGHSGLPGCGNPYSKVTQDLLAACKETASPAKIKKLLNAMYDLGIGGNVKAASLFLSYAVGKPKEVVQVIGDSKEALEIILTEARADNATTTAVPSDKV